ncbi:MAG: Rpn family recombination-promoting nuclease/putative transposase [Holosporales bacterium]
MTKNHLKPHDQFARAVLSQPKVIQDFVANTLPPHILEEMD